jgi:GNAT superfamily N-acetyltransferase
MDFRPIEPRDLEECADVLYAADDELTVARGLPLQPHNRQPLLKLFSHVLETSPDRSWLARQNGRVLGFSQAVRYEDLTFLSFMFVLPKAQSRGLGRELLERAMSGSTRRAVCIWSAQPISAALYARYGMAPLVPMYVFTGLPSKPLPPLPAGLELRALDASGAAELDREITGFTRTADHEWWSSMDRQRHGLYEGDGLVGYGYVQAGGRLGPAVVRRQEHLLPLLGALMTKAPPVDAWMVNVPGPAAQTFIGLLHAGLRLDGLPIVYCATDGDIDHSRYLPASFAIP